MISLVLKCMPVHAMVGTLCAGDKGVKKVRRAIQSHCFIRLHPHAPVWFHYPLLKCPLGGLETEARPSASICSSRLCPALPHPPASVNPIRCLVCRHLQGPAWGQWHTQTPDGPLSPQGLWWRQMESRGPEAAVRPRRPHRPPLHCVLDWKQR